MIMHDHDDQGAREHIDGRGRRRWAPLSAGALVGMGVLLGAPSAQASDAAVHPLGQCVDGKVVSGQGYVSIQGYDVVNTKVGRCVPPPNNLGLACKHGGIDLKQAGDSTGVTENDPVYAMANGEVLDLIGWGGTGENGEGEGVIVRHRDGSVAHYVHLAQIYVVRGQVVRQGQPLGRLMDYPFGGENNDHLHLEYRRAADPTVKSCEGSCAESTWQCKGKGYAVEPATAKADEIIMGNHGFVDPNVGLRAGIETPEILGWTRPAEQPLVDLRFNPNQTITNYGVGSGSISGEAELKRPYEDTAADFCDYQGRLDSGRVVSYAGGDETTFAAGVVFDLELELDQITSPEWVDILRAGDDDETTWRLVARLDEDTATRQLGLLATVAAAADDGDGDADPMPDMGDGADEEAPQTTVLELVGVLPEPQCRATPTAETCGAAPSECPVAPPNCDPALAVGVPIHCFSDFGYRQWRHIAGRYEASGTFRLLIDGEDFMSDFGSGDLVAPSDPMTVYVGGGMGMKVDDVRVWDLSNLDGEKSDDVIDPFGGGSRGSEDAGCQCSTSTGTGAGGSLLLLLGLWGLRRRRSARP